VTRSHLSDDPGDRRRWDERTEQHVSPKECAKGVLGQRIKLASRHVDRELAIPLLCVKSCIPSTKGCKFSGRKLLNLLVDVLRLCSQITMDGTTIRGILGIREGESNYRLNSPVHLPAESKRALTGPEL
jgi:hypothetical protein